ncbi:MAG: hypothetical protein GQ582_08970, partial [Methyloprofundus sp.]|nr:hypothetical protein [Methyloprofundus sp.]
YAKNTETQSYAANYEKTIATAKKAESEKKNPPAPAVDKPTPKPDKSED